MLDSKARICCMSRESISSWEKGGGIGNESPSYLARRACVYGPGAAAREFLELLEEGILEVSEMVVCEVWCEIECGCGYGRCMWWRMEIGVERKGSYLFIQQNKSTVPSNTEAPSPHPHKQASNLPSCVFWCFCPVLWLLGICVLLGLVLFTTFHYL